MDIDYENDDVRGFNRELDLVDAALVMTSVDFSPRKSPMPPVSTKVKARPPHSASAVTPIAGDPGLIVDDGNAAADDAIKERGLPDVWTTDYGDETWHACKMQ